MRRSAGFAITMALAASGAQAASAAPLLVTLPEARPLPTTEAAWPFLAANRNLRPLDLGAAGYAEREVLVSGKGPIFDWGPDAKAAPLPAPAQPYTGRILVRAPKDKARFSGVVVVELMNDSRSGDWPILWGYLHETLMRHGDAWVGITSPRASIGLKKFDPQRYAAVSFAPATPLACKTSDDSAEEGLRFDMIAQVGALLKSAGGANPLADMGVKTVLLTAQGAEVTTYAAAMQKVLRLPGDRPIYDGFLIKSAGALTKLNHCGQPVPMTDPRARLNDVGVPIIAVIPQGDVAESVSERRDDSDRKADAYRRYEVAAATHLDRYPYGSLPSLEDARRAGNAQGTVEWPFNVHCTPEIRLNEVPLLNYVLDAALLNLEAWVRTGAAPPRAPRMEVVAKGDGWGLVSDRFGVGSGGVRSPYADAPRAVYAMISPGPGVCADLGASAPLDRRELESLYGSPKAYEVRTRPMVEAMTTQRLLTPSDAAALRRDLADWPAPGAR